LRYAARAELLHAGIDLQQLIARLLLRLELGIQVQWWISLDMPSIRSTAPITAATVRRE
jgi:hypothetical protein